jgi:hypothetical protein
MKGQTQSYFIFDSHDSRVARKIFYQLEHEEDEFRKEHEVDDLSEESVYYDEMDESQGQSSSMIDVNNKDDIGLLEKQAYK